MAALLHEIGRAFSSGGATMVGIKHSFREKLWTVSRRRHKGVRHQVEVSRIMIKPRFEFERWDEEWRALIKGAVRLQNTRLGFCPIGLASTKHF